MHIIDNKALLLKTRKPERITSTIPKSQVLETRGDVSAVLVHWGLEECQVLKNLGFSPPSPIIGRYKWPGMYKPFEHQRTTAEFLTLYRRAYCFNDPGTGKTASIAWAADYLMRLGYVRRALIICPLSIMSSAWQGDLFKVLMHRRVDIAHGSRAKREKVIASDAEFVIINFDGVETVLEAIQNAQFDLVVIDEANAVKTPTTKRWKAINSILTPETWLWMATGTPASQSPADAYGLAKMLNPSSVPPYAYSFRDMVMWKVTQFKWVPKRNAQEIVHKTLQPAIRFTKDECLDLPELLYTTRECPLTTQQSQYYKTMKEMFAMEAAGETVTSVNAATNLNKLLQISSGAVYTDEGTTRKVLEFDITNRYKVLLEAIEESTHKVLVFIPFKHSIDILYDKLTKDKYSVEVISGDVPAHKRAKIFGDFQNTPDPRILLIQPAAASHGVTLHAANTIVWWAPVTSYETYVQANARIHRQGQKNNCLVVHLVGSAVEQKLYEALQNREAFNETLLDMYKEEIDV